MKTARIFLIGFFICVFLSVSFSVSFSQTTTAKVQDFLKFILAAKSFSEVGTAFNNAKFSQNELDQLKKAIASSPALTQKIQQLYNQAIALMKSRKDQFKQQALSKLDAIKSKYAFLQQQKNVAVQTALQQFAKTPGSCATKDTPMIISNTTPIEPGVLFQVLGEGFGKTRGVISLNLGGNDYLANIEAWGECYVGARIMSEISGLRATNYAVLVLKTAGGKETSKTTSFQPTLEFTSLLNFDSTSQFQQPANAYLFPGVPVAVIGGSHDWSLNDFQLKNDWFVSGRTFQSYPSGLDAHAEITYASAENSPNDIARTDVHAGWMGCSYVDWELFTYLSGPKGLSYK
jgi:hypothetical protein